MNDECSILIQYGQCCTPLPMEQNFILSYFGVYPLHSNTYIHWQEIQLKGKNTLNKTPLMYVNIK